MQQQFETKVTFTIPAKIVKDMTFSRKLRETDIDALDEEQLEDFEQKCFMQECAANDQPSIKDTPVSITPKLLAKLRNIKNLRYHARRNDDDDDILWNEGTFRVVDYTINPATKLEPKCKEAIFNVSFTVITDSVVDTLEKAEDIIWGVLPAAYSDEYEFELDPSADVPHRLKITDTPSNVVAK